MTVIPMLDQEKWPDVRRLKAGVTYNWIYSQRALQWLREDYGEKTSVDIAKEAMGEIMKDYFIGPEPLTFTKLQGHIGWSFWEEIVANTVMRLGESTVVKMCSDNFRGMAEESFLKGLQAFGLEGNDAVTAMSYHIFANTLCGRTPCELIVDKDGKRAYGRYLAVSSGRCWESKRGKVPVSVCSALGEYYQRAAELFSEKTGKRFGGGHIEPVEFILSGAPWCKMGYWEEGYNIP